MRLCKQTEISENDGRLLEECEASLQEALRDVRENYVAQMRGIREDIQTLHETKVLDFSEYFFGWYTVIVRIV